MKILQKLFLAMIILSFYALSCTPKIVEKTEVKEEKKETVVEVKEVERPTPCTMFKDRIDGEEVEEYYVIYKQFLKNSEFDQAYDYWSKAFRKAPGSNGVATYHFDDGVEIFKHYYSKETKNRKRWIDSIDMVYDKRIECFGDEAYTLESKAFDYYFYLKEDVEEDSIFNFVARAADIKKEKTDYFVINPFTSIMYNKFINGELDTATTKHYANILIDAIDYGVSHCKGEECDYWQDIVNYAPYLLDNFEGFKDFYPTSYYKKKYLTMFENSNKDCDTVNLVYRKLKWGGCDMNNPRLDELKKLVNTTCYEAPPTPGPLRQAFDYYNEGNFSDAVKYFDEYIEQADDVEKKAKYLLVIAKIYYRDMKNYPLSRKYALKAAKLKANWGEPYILIGKLYASSGPICGPGRGWDSQIVTWPAIDKFNYAKKIDPSVTKEANKLIRSYEKYMPNKEDMHMRGKQVGAKFKVGCWINETTTIRAAKE